MITLFFPNPCCVQSGKKRANFETRLLTVCTHRKTRMGAWPCTTLSVYLLCFIFFALDTSLHLQKVPQCIQDKKVYIKEY
jgi:hypothetical protein